MKRYLAKRVGVTVLVAVLIVLGAALVPMLSTPPEPTEMTYPEYDPASTISEPTPATGEIEPDPEAANDGVVVFDSSHLNRFDREDIAPLIRAFDRAGYEVRIYREGSLRHALDDADAFIVIDPAQPYTTAEAEMLGEFTDEGGRLLVLGEPNQIRVSLLGGLTTTRSRVSAIESEFDLHIDTRYVYDVEQDNNYKHVVASPSDDADVDGVEEVTLYTATEVRTTGSGTTVLETEPSAQTARSDQKRRHSMAAVDGNVMVIGDTTLVRDDRYNVGDNNEFLAYVVEFMIAGDSSYDPGPDDENGSENGSENETASGQETAAAESVAVAPAAQ